MPAARTEGGRAARRRWLRAGLGAAFAAAAPSRTSGAEPYPSRQVKLVVGYAPGGPADAAARHLAALSEKALGQPVIVENRAGAAGSLAAAAVARAAPDGHTLLYGTSDVVLHAVLNAGAAYRPIEDFVPVVGISLRALVLVAHPALGVRTVQELAALARAKPGDLSFESSGIGSIEHLAAELFRRETGAAMVHVPYKGSAPAILDLIGGRVHLGFEVPLGVAAHVQAGKLVALMTTGKERLASLPAVPTAYEAGLPAMDLRVPWAGLFAPAGTPPDRVRRLATVFGAARNAQEARSHPVFTDSQSIAETPERFAAFVQSEHARWGKIVREAGIAIGASAVPQTRRRSVT